MIGNVRDRLIEWSVIFLFVIVVAPVLRRIVTHEASLWDDDRIDIYPEHITGDAMRRAAS